MEELEHRPHFGYLLYRYSPEHRARIPFYYGITFDIPERMRKHREEWSFPFWYKRRKDYPNRAAALADEGEQIKGINRWLIQIGLPPMKNKRKVK